MAALGIRWRAEERPIVRCRVAVAGHRVCVVPIESSMDVVDGQVDGKMVVVVVDVGGGGGGGVVQVAGHWQRVGRYHGTVFGRGDRLVAVEVDLVGL